MACEGTSRANEKVSCAVARGDPQRRMPVVRHGTLSERYALRRQTRTLHPSARAVRAARLEATAPELHVPPTNNTVRETEPTLIVGIAASVCF